MDSARGAAPVARDLLAFYREPARHRPPYLHREVAMPDGQVVFRLALGRLPPGWLRDLPAGERDEVREAAAAFVRQVCLWERATHYQVLCAEPGATRESLKENYQLLIALIHPDRQEPGSSWPTGCAQRANGAYETLTNASSRAEYDIGLQHAGHSAALDAAARMAHAPEPHRPRRTRPSPGSLLKRFALVAGVIAALFIVQAWWVGDVSPQHSLLERAMPASARWMREVLPDAPRFLSHAAPSTVAFDPGDPLVPLKEPRRVASLGAWVPVPEPSGEVALTLSTNVAVAPVSPPQPPTAAIPVAGETSMAVRAPVPQLEAAAPAARPAPSMLAQAAAPMRVAQAPAAPSSAVPSRDQVELVVATLVGSYDAGDAERLVSLLDPDGLGWFGGYRLRGTYGDFFTSTRSRRLRMEQLGWQYNGSLAQARGEATVMAEFTDGRPRMERRVPVELDIALFDGQPRITRLQLYPGVR